jgi:hypothetical protein
LEQKKKMDEGIEFPDAALPVFHPLIQKNKINGLELQESEAFCPQCKETRPLTDFSLREGKWDRWRTICCECQRLKRHEQHRRLAAQRERWQQREQKREERRLNAWERHQAVRQAQEERWRERERWYLQQPDRRCRTCRQILPASDFGGNPSANGFVLQVRCKACHTEMLEHRQIPCCLCQKKTPRTNFLSHFNGYALCGGGTSISLCCKECEAAFLALPLLRQGTLIRSCCQRAFPRGQVIYAEADPETHEIRYVGRTSKPEHRHAQHLRAASPTRGQWGAERKAWYTRGNWIQELFDRGLQPSMQILRSVEVSARVVEWEQRYIWHGIQQGWELLNVEAVDEELVARIKTSFIDFLKVPLETLVQQRFFSAQGLVAFLHQWN